MPDARDSGTTREDGSVMGNIAHWTEADELPRCQHCELPAAEHSFMCEDHAFEADTERETLTEQLRGAVEALRPFVEAFDRADREFCPSFDGPLDLEAFNRAARVIDGGQ